MKQSVVLVVAKPVPKVATSAAMAEWRKKQAERVPDIKVAVTPVEGLGAPAIRSDVDDGPPTVEVAVSGLLLGVTAPTFDVAKALATKAIARLR